MCGRFVNESLTTLRMDSMGGGTAVRIGVARKRSAPRAARRSIGSGADTNPDALEAPPSTAVLRCATETKEWWAQPASGHCDLTVAPASSSIQMSLVITI